MTCQALSIGFLRGEAAPKNLHLLDKLISVKVMVGGIDVDSGELCPDLVQST